MGRCTLWRSIVLLCAVAHGAFGADDPTADARGPSAGAQLDEIDLAGVELPGVEFAKEGEDQPLKEGIPRGGGLQGGQLVDDDGVFADYADSAGGPCHRFGQSFDPELPELSDPQLLKFVQRHPVPVIESKGGKKAVALLFRGDIYRSEIHQDLLQELTIATVIRNWIMPLEAAGYRVDVFLAYFKVGLAHAQRPPVATRAQSLVGNHTNSPPRHQNLHDNCTTALRRCTAQYRQGVGKIAKWLGDRVVGQRQCDPNLARRGSLPDPLSKAPLSAEGGRVRGRMNQGCVVGLWRIVVGRGWARAWRGRACTRVCLHAHVHTFLRA